MDLYAVLELTPTANQADIKRQYRRLANIYHPDKKNGDAEKFKAINDAYEILSDKAKKAHYDDTGATDQQAAKNLVTVAIMDLFNSIFENHYITDNFIAEARTINSRQTISFTSKITAAKQRLARFTANKDKIKVTAGENLAAILLDQKIAKINHELKQFEFHRDISQRVTDTLKNYNDVNDIINDIELLNDDPDLPIKPQKENQIE